MDDLTYLNFDLTLLHPGNKYRVRVDSPGGQASADFILPFSEEEITSFLSRFGGEDEQGQAPAVPLSDAVKSFGGRLYRAVFADQILACLVRSQDEADRQKKGLRIRLNLSDVPELGRLPWEFLYDQSLNRFLGVSKNTPIVRYLDLPEYIRSLEVEPPLHVLVMISSPTDQPPLDVDGEWDRLRKAVGDLEKRGKLVLERMDKPTLSDLQDRLRGGPVHILHFIGHGVFDEQSKDGVLLFERENRRGDLVSGGKLGTLLHDQPSLRLVILNACQGARASTTDPYSGAAQGLVQQGIPAVIAMQFEIGDEAAITFSQNFYKAISDNYPVDGALAEARKAINNTRSALEWATPVLYMRAGDGRIFITRPAAPVSAPARAPVTAPAPVAASAPSPKPAPARGRPPFLLLGIGAVVLLLICVGLYMIGTSSDSTSQTPTVVAGALATLAPTSAATTALTAPTLAPTAPTLAAAASPTAVAVSTVPVVAVVPAATITPTVPVAAALPTATIAPTVPAPPAPAGKIVFSLRLGEDNFTDAQTVGIMSADGKQASQILKKASQPALSPDGTQIAYYHWTDGIYIVNADGSNAPGKRIVNGTFIVKSIAWSSKGVIAYTTTRQDGSNSTINFVNVDGSKAPNEPFYGNAPAWSPNGQELAYNNCDGSNCGIFRGQTRITSDNGTFPAWSPRGDKIVYQAQDSSGNIGLYIVNPDGSGRKALVPSGRDPVWSADGNSIFYRTAGASGWGIWRIDSEGKGPAQPVVPVDPSGSLPAGPLPPAQGPYESNLSYSSK